VRFTRMQQPVSSFQLRVGVELVVVVPEYLRFRSTHRFTEETLQQFHPPNAHAASTVSVLDLCRATGTGLLRAKVVSFIPIVTQDYRSQRKKHPSSSEWNKLYGGTSGNETPMSPWCVLVCRVEDGGSTKPQHFTLYYLDAHWQAESRLTPTSWQMDAATNMRHLATPNSAHFLLEGELLDAAMQQDWKVNDIVTMKMFRHVPLQLDPPSPTILSELIDRVGRIVGIQVAAVDPKQIKFFHRSTVRCVQVMWFKEEMTPNGPECSIDLVRSLKTSHFQLLASAES
jgi:hypothetical protein